MIYFHYNYSTPFCELEQPSNQPTSVQPEDHLASQLHRSDISMSSQKRVENTAVFETISNTDANSLNLHIDKATKTRGDKQLYLITHFTKQTLNLNYLLLKLKVTE